VGQDEHPFSLVRRADFTRREYSPRALITNAFQFSNDFAESEADVSFDIFKEAESWPKKSNSVCNPRPEVSWIVFTCSLACGREWLTRVSCNEDVHQSVKRSVWEGFKIAPYRCDIQESFFHLTDEIGLSEPLKLTICDGPQSLAKDVFESKSNAAISGAHFESCNGRGIIHIVIPSAPSASSGPAAAGSSPCLCAHGRSAARGRGSHTRRDTSPHPFCPPSPR